MNEKLSFYIVKFCIFLYYFDSSEGVFRMKFCVFLRLISSFLLFCSSLAYANNSITTHFLKHDNPELFLQEFPPQVTKKAPNILLVHGLTYSSHQFDVNYEDYSLARFLARNGYRVWLIDITGYGRSSKPENGFIVDTDYAAADIALAAAYIRQTTHSKKIDVLGWSWGTITTSRFAATHPDWVNKLILFAPIYRGLNLPEPTDDYQTFSVTAALGDMPKIEEGSEEIDYQKIIKPVVDLYTQQCISYDSANSPNGGRRDLFQSDDIILFEPQKLTMPVLIIAGTDDPYLDFDNDIPEIRTLLPNKQSQYYEVAEGSHILMIEKEHYHNFQQEILTFLKK
jgi:pimeloyl-ACP methyl ester carboxylesterase